MVSQQKIKKAGLANEMLLCNVGKTRLLNKNRTTKLKIAKKADIPIRLACSAMNPSDSLAFVLAKASAITEGEGVAPKNCRTTP
ncbi:hypothetical protein GCM10009007_12820 [Formosimonas limnophila]|uniref:Uncharacterized protein n=1 Tax=Formosimonas limnophila TaxID=1384487 RepID=A0A8J3CHR2_9BURK|nr:hypothetical protein [Formosimonas limnophila]GHA73329.1 hypothetical protein GCM10009007_12820 [Formosimonas limnophila]